MGVFKTIQTDGICTNGAMGLFGNTILTKKSCMCTLQNFHFRIGFVQWNISKDLCFQRIRTMLGTLSRLKSPLYTVSRVFGTAALVYFRISYILKGAWRAVTPHAPQSCQQLYHWFDVRCPDHQPANDNERAAFNYQGSRNSLAGSDESGMMKSWRVLTGVELLLYCVVFI